MKNKYLRNLCLTIFGIFLYAIGINLFAVPSGLYAGGLYGYCQIIRTFLDDFIHYENLDIAGFIYTIANIPLLFFAIKLLNKKFFINTILGIITSNIFLSFITIKTPFISDTLTNCIMGGILSGIGLGITLRAGSSMGGTDIIGMCIVKKYPKVTMGKVFIILDIILYIICALFFNIEIAIYSLIFSFISSIATDKMHSQNIKINAIIFTNNYEIAKEINQKLVRGSTSWIGKGDFSKNKKYVISTVISKYEENDLREIIHKLDQNAFVIINSNIQIDGNIESRLDG